MKPQYLYHASQNRKIVEFEPRAESVRDQNEGPVVFATPSKAYASCFLVPTDGSWVAISSWTNKDSQNITEFPERQWYFICSDEQRFKKLDKGGAIYTLPADTFSYDENLGTGHNEWTSKVPVKPVEYEIYESALSAMLELGVKVFFVDEQLFTEIREAEDNGFQILQQLESEGKSVPI